MREKRLVVDCGAELTPPLFRRRGGGELRMQKERLNPEMPIPHQGKGGHGEHLCDSGEVRILDGPGRTFAVLRISPGGPSIKYLPGISAKGGGGVGWAGGRGHLDEGAVEVGTGVAVEAVVHPPPPLLRAPRAPAMIMGGGRICVCVGPRWQDRDPNPPPVPMWGHALQSIMKYPRRDKYRGPSHRQKSRNVD